LRAAQTCRSRAQQEARRAAAPRGRLAAAALIPRLAAAAPLPPKPPKTPRRQLLALNPDNYRLHEGLQASLGLAAGDGGALTPGQRAGLREEYKRLRAEFPRGAAVLRIPLDFTVSSLLGGTDRAAMQHPSCEQS
jgi:hypothetical protein